MITKISKNAFVISAICSRNKKMYGITIDKTTSGYSLIWAFPLTKQQASKEGFESTAVCGNIEADVNYPGCPHCGSKQFYVCNNCKSVVCYHGEEHVVCPTCGIQGEIIRVDKIDLKAGSM